MAILNKIRSGLDELEEQVRAVLQKQSKPRDLGRKAKGGLAEIEEQVRAVLKRKQREEEDPRQKLKRQQLESSRERLLGGKQTTLGQFPSAARELAKEAAQETARSVASAGLTAGYGGIDPETGDYIKEVPLPKEGLGRKVAGAIFGEPDKPLKAIETRIAEGELDIKDFGRAVQRGDVELWGASKETGKQIEDNALGLSVVGVGGMIFMDFTPLGGRSTVAKQLAKTESVAEVIRLLRSARMPEKLIKEQAEVIAKTRSATVIDDLLRRGKREFESSLKDASQILRGTQGLTADDIMKTHPNIKLTKDVPVKDIHGNKVEIAQGEKLTPYELKGNKVLLQDGETYIVSKNQFQNIKGQSVVGEGKPFAPELEGLEETIKGVSKWKGDELIDDGNRLADVYEGENGKWHYRSDAVEESPAFNSRKEAMENAEADALGIYSGNETKYSQYQLPGGENYREVLIRKPLSEPMKVGDISIRDDGDFKSSHWDEPNVISHLRLNDRTYNGKKVTFMEELQSDWAREGRSKGFTNEAELRIRTLEKEAVEINRKGITNKQLDKRLGEIRDEQRSLVGTAISGVPNNSNLKNWTETSVKRGLKDAVDNDAEYFAWINGEQTSARYNLATQVDSVKWGNRKLGGKAIEIQPKQGSSINLRVDEKGIIGHYANTDSSWVGKKLDEVLGKGLADKIMGKKTGKLSGEGLSFGGEWADNLYSKQVKNIVEDVTGGKVEKIDMGLPVEKTKYNFTLIKPSGEIVSTLNPENMKVGKLVKTGIGGDYYIIVDILGDGKFEAISKSNNVFRDKPGITYSKRISGTQNWYDPTKVETFNISNKTTTQQAIKLTPEIKAKIRGEAPQIKTSGKLFELASKALKNEDAQVRLEVTETLRRSEIVNALPQEQVEKIVPELAEYQKLQTGLRGKWQGIREMVQDQFIRGRKLQQAVTKGDPIPDDLNIEQARTLFDGRVHARLEDTHEAAQRVDKQIVTTAKQLGVGADELTKEVNSFLHARHALERNRQLGKDGAAGLTNDEARGLLKELEASPHKAAIDAAAEQISEINNQVLDTLRDAEVIDQATHDLLRKTYKHHVPLQRIMETSDDVTQVLSGGRGLDVKSTGIRRAKGSELPVADILTNVIANAEQAINRAEKNMVDLSVLRFARAHKGIGGLLEEVKPPLVPVARETFEKDVDAVLRQNLIGFAEKLGVTVKDARRIEHGRAKAFGVFQKKGFGQLAERVIKTRYASDEGTLAHELGHAIDDRIPAVRELLVEPMFEKELDKVALSRVRDAEHLPASFRSYLTSMEEKIAETFSLYITDRALAIKLAPQTTKALDNFIKGDAFLSELAEFAPSNVNEILSFQETIFRPKPEILMNDPSVLTLFEGGKRKYLKINDPRLAVTLKGVGIEQTPSMMKWISTVTRFYSGLHTRFNYEFAFSNNVRDVQEMMVFTASQREMGFGAAGKALVKDPQSKKAVVDFLLGRDTQGAKLYQQMRLDGGTTGGLGLSTRQKVELDIAAIRRLNRSKPRQAAAKMLQVVDGWNTLFEDATRLSVYRTALERGLSRKQAAALAKESTINFNKKGTAGPIINGLYMFSNASIQGSAKMLKAMRDPKVAATVTTAMGTATYAAHEWNDRVDPDWRDKVTRWDRSSNLVIMLPSDTEEVNYVTVPISWGLKPLNVMLNYASDATAGHGDLASATQGVMTSFLEAYNPLAGDEDILRTIVPTVGKVPFEIRSNRNWFGSRIRPGYDDNVPRSAEYFKSLGDSLVGRKAIEGTEALSEMTGGRIEISPADAVYAFEQYIGGAGKSVTRLIETIASVSQGEEVEAKQRPVLNRFMKNRSEEEVLEDLFYSERERMDKTKAREKVERTRQVTPIYEEAQMLMEAGDEAQATALVDALDEADYEVYKSLKAVDKRRAGSTLEIEMFSVVRQVTELLQKGDEASVQRIINKLSDNEYEAYQKARDKYGLGQLGLVLEVRGLLKAGSSVKAQTLIDELSEEEYKSYLATKKQLGY
jgi:hypothetical protein